MYKTVENIPRKRKYFQILENNLSDAEDDFDDSYNDIEDDIVGALGNDFLLNSVNIPKSIAPYASIHCFLC